MDKARTFQGNPCGQCGSIIRYVSDGKCVACKAGRGRLYRAKNHKRIAAKKKEYRERNAELISEKYREWLESNRDRKAESDRRWAMANQDRVKRSHKKWRSRPENSARVAANSIVWRENNRDRAHAYEKEWRTKNREMSIAKTHRRRARLYGSGGSYTAHQWNDLVALFNGKCLCCGRADVRLTVDHIVPLSRGGNNDIENIQPLCKICNDKKGSKTIDFRFMQ